VNGTPVHTSGSVKVSGRGASASVTFAVPTPSLVSLQFDARGIASVVRWSVGLTPQSSGLTIELAFATVNRSAAGGSPIVFHVSPGAYSYTATALGQTPVGGSVEVLGAATPASVTIAFAPATTGNPPPRGIPALLTGTDSVGIALLLVIGSLGAAMLVVRAYRIQSANRAAFEAIFRTEWEADSEGQPIPRRPD
jgi:hypothetical protein